MSKNNKRIKELAEQITQARNDYYNGQSTISDDEYDILIDELTELNPQHSAVVAVGNFPTTGEWQKEPHRFPLGSLNKFNAAAEVEKWMAEALGHREVLVSEKLDGLSIGCQYENGKLIKAILRGDGTTGENILANVLKMGEIVKSIPGFDGVLRGEIILTKSKYIKFFKDQGYANPRNSASGLCRKLDGDGCEHLDVIFYQVLGSDLPTEEDHLKFLKKHGCKTPNYKVCQTSIQVVKFWQEYQNSVRDSLDYEIDGLVISCNDMEFQESLGEHNLRSKGKVAFKFANQLVKTTVKEITWSTGNSGRITPICWVEPVSLLGSTVQKASIYNTDYIRDLGIGVGAEVLICKANEIIPRIEKVIKQPKKVIETITNCPSCDAELVFSGKHLNCPNSELCPAQNLGKLYIWIKEQNILEFGKKILQKLIDSDMVVDIPDLYRLDVKKLANLERMGEKSATKLVQIMEANKNIALENIIAGLGIHQIGTSMVRLCVDAGYDTLDKLHGMTITEIENIPGFASIKAKCLHEGLKQNKERIQSILDAGVTIKEKVKMEAGTISVCFTGTLSIKRAEAQKMASDKGWINKDGIVAGLTYLVMAQPDSTSSKSKKAAKLGVKCIDETEFMALLQK